MPTPRVAFVRSLRPRDPDEAHRVSTPLELLTDLCFVVAVAQSAMVLHHDISEAHLSTGIVHFSMAFFAIWWAWLNFTWFGSAYDNDDVVHRLLTLLQILGSLILAAGVARSFEDDFTLVVVGYVVMRLGLVLQWIRVSRSDPDRSRTGIRYALGITVVQVGWVAFLFLPSSFALPVFVLLALCELAVPIWAERSGSTPWHPHHIAERYGLFFIIVLGEVILSTTLAIQEALDNVDVETPLTMANVVLGGVLIVFSLWWLYFARDAGPVLEKATSGLQSFAWGFAHLFIFAGVTALGAGLAARVDFWTHHSEESEIVTGAMVTVPVVIVLAAIWAVQVRLHDSSARALIPFAAAIVVILASTFVPGTELVVGVVCVILLVVELSASGARE